MKTILLDLDGVCVDFVHAACKVHGGSPNKVKEWNGVERMAETPEAFWAGVDTHDFWATLAPFPWYEELLDLCRSLGDTYFCTTPSRSPVSLSGKLEWMHNHAPADMHRKYVLTPQKHLLANQNSLLIDDGDHNIARFAKAGGGVCLFPQPWNELRDLSGQSMDVVKARILRKKFNGRAELSRKHDQAVGRLLGQQHNID